MLNKANEIDKISKIWAETLDLEKVEPSDDFFSLGGDSIMATIMAFKIEEAFDRVVNVDMIFDHPTLSEFAHAFSSNNEDDIVV